MYKRQAYVATVDAYNTALTKTTMPDLSVGRHGLASAVIGDYALFAGGISKISSAIDPVSYTHLDVYKRQHVHHSGRRGSHRAVPGL